MELEVKEARTLEDGKHFGQITKVEYRDDPYAYTDLYIKEKETGMELKHGCPTSISDKSKLGKLLSNFTNLIVGQKIDPQKVLVGRDIQFMTIAVTNRDGTFARVVDGSVKPKVTEERI